MIFVDVCIFNPLAALTFYRGYSAICRKEQLNPERNVIVYRIAQGILCVLWLIFSFIRSGCFDGWTRITALNENGSGGAKFCIFLVVIQALLYHTSTAMGVFGIIKVAEVKLFNSFLIF
jgi:hypothetical protein